MDETLNLAFSLLKNPGVYALLLGSGISRTAGIPTGWEVAQDLIRRINGAGGDLSEDTGYDVLIDTLGKTAAERNSTIREYFEPNSVEQEQGLKVPSAAHKAIAQLVKDSYIKLIFTTNFDRLIELALEDIGIVPEVISSDDMIQGARPIRHSKITVVKLHGDYRDIRTLNTTQELEKYSETKDTFLDSLLSEYGLIACGWSATWDKALRDAIYRIKPTWYSTYWIEPFEPSREASGLIQHRQATVIQATADVFFGELQQKVEALEKLSQVHPLSISVAVERVKKFLPHETTQIELEDLLRNEAERVYEEVAGVKEYYPLSLNATEKWNLLKSQCEERLAKIETLLHMVIALCWYGKGQQASLLTSIIRRWTPIPDINSDLNYSRKMPILLLMYVGGIASLTRSNWSYLNALIAKPQIYLQVVKPRYFPILELVKKSTCFDYGIFRSFLDNDPVSKYLKQQLRPLFQMYIPIDHDFFSTFDLFEMLVALLNFEFSWIDHDAPIDPYFEHVELEQFWRDGGKQKANWGFVREFYGGDTMKLKSDLEKYFNTAKSAHTKRLSSPFPNYADIYSEALR